MATKYLSSALSTGAFNITQPLIRYSNKPLETTGFYESEVKAKNYITEPEAYIGQELTIFDKTNTNKAYKYFISNTNEITKLLDERDVDNIGSKCYKITTNNSKSIEILISENLSDKPKPVGTIVIIERTGTDIGTTRTAYSLATDGKTWEAFNGNYSAENVIMPADLEITEQFGIHKPSSTGTVIVPCKGQSIYNLISTSFSADDETVWITTAGPLYTVTKNFDTSGEVGSSIPSKSSNTFYKITRHNESYKYGSWNTETSPPSPSTSTDPGISITQESYLTSGTFPSVFKDSMSSIQIKSTITRKAVSKDAISRLGKQINRTETKNNDKYGKFLQSEIIQNKTETISFSGWRYLIYHGYTSNFIKSDNQKKYKKENNESTYTFNISLTKDQYYYVTRKGSSLSSDIISFKKKDAYGNYEPANGSLSISTESNSDIYIKPENKTASSQSLVVSSITTANFAAAYTLFTIKAIDSGDYQITVEL